MAKIYFISRSVSNDPEAEISIWARISIGRKADIRIPTGLHITQKYWDKKRERPKDYHGTSQEITKTLSDLDSKLKDLREILLRNAYAYEDFSKDIAKSLVSQFVEKDRVHKSDKPRQIDKYCQYVIDGMEDGSRRLSSGPHRGERYTKNTIKSWKVFQKAITEFLSEHFVTWDTMDESTLIAFKDYMSNHGYMNATQNKLFGTFRALSSMAYSDKVSSRKDIFDSMPKADVLSSGTKSTNIYLTEDEIEAIYQAPLTPGSLQDKVRDIFCMGCYTGQRVSDYNHLSPDMFCKSAHGGQIIKLKQTKTKQDVTIPVLNSHMIELAEKYNYNMPSVSDVIINRYIKNICEDLSKTIPSLAQKYVTPMTMQEESKDNKSEIKCERDSHGNAILPKWALIKTHTARRSCITNLYLTGILSDQEIMSISGHKDFESYKRYLCMSSETIAEGIAKKFADYKEKNK